MIENIKKHKVLTAVAVVVLMAIGWFFVSGGSSKEAAPLLETSGLSASASGNATVGRVDRELQDTLDKVRAIQLNNQVLSDPIFLSLNDIGQQIVPEPFGRPNPFAPIQSAR
jgi:hypothetical protein